MLVVNGKSINVYFECNFEVLFWVDLGVDVVLECIGIFCFKEKVGLYFKVGVKDVVIFVFVKGEGV